MLKPLSTLLSAVALAGAALAQNVFIGLPKANTNVTAGANITVQIDRPMTLTSSWEVAVAIGVFPCHSGCPGASEVLGDILYVGPYAPKLYHDAWDPYANFTVTIPSSYRGTIQLGVAHFFLLGAGQSGQLQTIDTTLFVV